MDIGEQINSGPQIFHLQKVKWFVGLFSFLILSRPASQDIFQNKVGTRILLREGQYLFWKIILYISLLMRSSVHIQKVPLHRDERKQKKQKHLGLTTWLEVGTWVNKNSYKGFSVCLFFKRMLNIQLKTFVFLQCKYPPFPKWSECYGVIFKS